MEQLGGRGDRIARVEDRQPASDAGRHEAPGQGRTPRDVAVRARPGRSRLHLVCVGEQLGGLPEVVAGLERGQVSLQDHRLCSELLLDPIRGDVGRASVHPRQQAEGEHVLGPLRLLLRDAETLSGPHGDRGHGNAEHLVAIQGAVVEGVRRVAGLLQVPVDEGVLVDDQHPALLQVPEVGLEGGGVHGHQDVGLVTGRRDVPRGEVDLERGDPGQGAGRSADLGGEVGERRQVVAQHRRRAGEPVAGQLHAVAGVAGEPHDGAFQSKRGLGYGHVAPLGPSLRSPPTVNPGSKATARKA